MFIAIAGNVGKDLRCRRARKVDRETSTRYLTHRSGSSERYAMKPVQGAKEKPR
jgi:hypothetical protein